MIQHPLALLSFMFLVVALARFLEKQPKDKTVTSYALHKIFEHRSANDPSFMWAVILHLKLVSPSPDKKRQYIYDSPDAFLAKIDKLKSRKS